MNRTKVSLIVRPTAVILLTISSIENPNRDLKEVVIDPNLVKGSQNSGCLPGVYRLGCHWFRLNLELIKTLAVTYGLVRWGRRPRFSGFIICARKKNSSR